MNLTNEAIDFIKDALEEEATKAIRVYTEAGCCGPSLDVLVAPPEATDEVRVYDGFTFAVAEEARAMAEGVTLDVEATEEGVSLILRGLQNSCC